MDGAVAFCVGVALFCFYSSWLGFRLNRTRSSEELASMSTTDADYGVGRTVAGWLETAILHPGWLLAVATVFSVGAILGALWISLS